MAEDGVRADPRDVEGEAVSSSPRSRLTSLASRKRREQAEEEVAQKRRKSDSGIDFGDSDDEEPVEPSVAVAAHGRGNPAEETGAGADDDDHAFIDDEGVPEDGRIDFGDDEDEHEEEGPEEGRFAEDEAHEDIGDELDRMFKKKQRPQGEDEEQAKAAVERLLAQMEVAVEEDMKSFDEGKPAVHKLRLLTHVEDMLAKKKYHGEFLDGGILGVLKAWVEPLPDGSLPNTRIRSAVLRILDELPIDCSYEDRKTQLKRSGLGRMVLFLSRVSDETPQNRRLAKALVERWSRPILATRPSYRADESEQERTLASRKARLAETRAGEVPLQTASETGLRPGDQGFRWRADIPRAATLDYVRRPESKVNVPDSSKTAAARERLAEHKLSKKLKGMSKTGQSARAADVSVEGRNVTLRH